MHTTATETTRVNDQDAFSTIVVGTDGSETAKAAVGRAIMIAKVHDARLHVVVAYEPRLTSEFAQAAKALDEQAWRASPGEQAEQIVDDTASRASVAGVAVEPHVETGDAANALIEVAEREGAQLIVVGSKGLASVARFLLGSVPSKVAHHAHCDVLIVRTT